MATLGNPVNSGSASQALTAIAGTCGEHYKWAKTALVQINANLGSPSLLTQAGITDSNEISQINTAIQFLAGYVAFMEGTETAVNTTNWTATFIPSIRGLGF